MHRTFLLAVALFLFDIVSSFAQTPGDVMMERYLAHETARRAPRFLDGATTLKDWQERGPRLQREFLDMLGLWPMPEKTPLRATVTGTIERDGFIIEKLHFQSMPCLYVTAHLYRPKKVEAKLPAVVLFMGHYNRGRNGHKSFMQDHGMWFASNGYVCIILDTLERGEIPGRSHHGLYRNDAEWWLASGFTPAGIECWNGVRAIDYLVSRPEVDAERLAATGLSGGGTVTFWVTAVDERVRCAVPVSGMTDLESNIANRLMCLHCDCQLPYNLYDWEWTTVAALAAPRPLLFVNSHDDIGFPMAANRRIMTRLRAVYDLHGKPEQLDEFVSQGPPGAHAYRPDSRVAIFKWLNRHLKNETGSVKDADFDRIPEERMRVFPEDTDFPKDVVNATIDEALFLKSQVPLPEPGKFDIWRRDLLARLRERPFRAFPERIPASDRTPADPPLFKFKDLAREDGKLARTTEAGIDVRLGLSGIDSQAEPRAKSVTLVVLNEDEDPYFVPVWAKDSIGNDAVVVLAPRGCGPGRFTPQVPPNFVVRAHALLGRTLDQGRVWDVAAIARWLERPAGVKVVGRGRAGIVAAYAALFEPSIGEVVVLDPPASHKSGPMFLHVLRILDVPDALGLLAPRTLTLVDAKDDSFARTAEIYKRAGAEKQLRIR